MIDIVQYVMFGLLITSNDKVINHSTNWEVVLIFNIIALLFALYIKYKIHVKYKKKKGHRYRNG